MSKYHTIVLHDANGKVTDRLIKNPNSILNDINKMPVHNNVMYRFNDSISFWDGYTNKIIRVASDHNIIYQYTLDLGKQKLPDRLKNSKNSSEYWNEVNKYSFITKVFETEKNIFINCSQKGKFFHALYNKETKQVVSVPNKDTILNDIHFHKVDNPV